MLKLVFTLLVVGFSAGCSRESNSSTATSASTPSPTEASGANSDAAAPSDNSTSGETSTAPSPIPQRTTDLDSKELEVALAELTQVLRKYSFEHQRVPKTFNEVVAAGYMKGVPQAPPGKKFEIDPKTVQVVLVKQ